MAKVTVVQVIYNHRPYIEPVFSTIFNQTFKDLHVVAVISGNSDGGKELLMQKFPQVEIIDPGFNIGFAAGHNLVFEKYKSDYFQLVNPDLIMAPNYIEEILKVFDDEKVGAATGKLYQVERQLISNFQFPISKGFTDLVSLQSKTIDSTGVVISKSGRARDRGQHEVDTGQYDSLANVDAVSGAGCMYRASALNATRYILNAKAEFFDEDFHSYWEDVDLAWRMRNLGWACKFQPSAIAYHGRGAGSSRGGYFHAVDFIKHHRALNPRIRELNYQNHIFMYIKNSPWFYPQFFVREFFMLVYISIFEISTLNVVPNMLKLLPKIWQKRKTIQALAHD